MIKSVTIKSLDFSKFGLSNIRPGQIALYNHIKKCSDKNQEVKFFDVADIYFKNVKNPEGIFMRITNRKARNKDIASLYIKEQEQVEWKRYVRVSVVNWLKANVGSLVIKGALKVTPVWDPEILKELL